MAPDVPDYRTPSPDAGHEAIRAPLAQAVDDLAAAVAVIGENVTGVEDSYFLANLLFTLLDGALASITQLTTDVTALEARIAALEPPAEPAP